MEGVGRWEGREVRQTTVLNCFFKYLWPRAESSQPVPVKQHKACDQGQGCLKAVLQHGHHPAQRCSTLAWWISHGDHDLCHLSARAL